MTSHAKKSAFRPFKDLDALVKGKNMVLADRPPYRRPTSSNRSCSPEQEAKLFSEAMADVTPLSFDRHWQLPKGRLSYRSVQNDEEAQAVKALHRLIQTGSGFVVSDTPEYMEATAPGTYPEMTRRLHRGHYSVQDYVDLHGLRVPEAQDLLHGFIRKAIAKGQRAVLVVHGRGLTSPRKPVLKHKVYQWLTRGPLRKYVMALTSARACDGGTGATYVLLRQRPLSKRQRKAAFGPQSALQAKI